MKQTQDNEKEILTEREKQIISKIREKKREEYVYGGRIKYQNTQKQKIKHTKNKTKNKTKNIKNKNKTHKK